MDTTPGLEAKAAQLFQRGSYTEALQTYTACIESSARASKGDVNISLIFNRSACYLKLKQFRNVVDDCNRVLLIDPSNSKAKGRKIKALCSLGQFTEAQEFAEQWIRREPSNLVARKEWEKLDVIIKALKEQDDDGLLVPGYVSPQHKLSPVGANQALLGYKVQKQQGNTSSLNRSPQAWQSPGDEKREVDITWGRANNTSWEGLPDEHPLSQFPSLNRASSNNSDASLARSLSNDPSSENNSTPGANHQFGKVTFFNPLSEGIYQGTARKDTQPRTIADYVNRNNSDFYFNLPSTAKPQTTGSKSDTNSRWFDENSRPAWNESPVNKQEKSTPNPGPISQDFDVEVSRYLSKKLFPGQAINSWNSSNASLSFTGSTVPHQPTSDPTPTYSSISQMPSAASNQAGLGLGGPFNGKTSSPIDPTIEAALHMPLSSLNSVLDTNSAPSQSRFNLYKSLDSKHSCDPGGAGGTIARTDAAKSDNPTTSSSSLATSIYTVTTASNNASSHGFVTMATAANSVDTAPKSVTDESHQRGLSSYQMIHQAYVLDAGSNKSADFEIPEFKPLSKDSASDQQTTKSSINDVQPQFLQTKAKISNADIGKATNSSSLKEHVDSNKTAEEVESAKEGEQRTWNYRQPPRGLTSQEYTLCPEFKKRGRCSMGENCTHAHSEAELSEWKQRFEDRKQSLQQRTQEEGAIYADKLLERILTKADDISEVVVDNLDGVNVHVNDSLNVKVNSKKSTQTWTFTVTSKKCLQRVCLLDDSNRKQFHISHVTVGPRKQQRNQKLPDSCQYWVYPDYKTGKMSMENIFRISMAFKTDIFGTFSQTVILDFGSEPVLQRELCVDAKTVMTDSEKLSKDLIINETGRWDTTKMRVIEYQPKPYEADDEDLVIMEKYPSPSQNSVENAIQTLEQPSMTCENYRARMHALLLLEEMAQYAGVAKFNVTTPLMLVKSFMLTSATKKSLSKSILHGELFARFSLQAQISEDTASGRLILQNVNTALLAPAPAKETLIKANQPNGVIPKGGKNDKKEKLKTGKNNTKSGKLESTQNLIETEPEPLVPEKVYEAMVEEKGKDFILLRLSKQCVDELGLKEDETFNAQIQFELNRMPVVEMHQAVDKLPEIALVFPSVEENSAIIPWTPNKQWHDKQEASLNAKQKEAVIAITTDRKTIVPPILLVGPYGTGKTFTLAQTANQILEQPDTRVLICAHSNSAADLYIREYLHPHVESGHRQALPLRVYYRQRRVQTVHPIVLRYCLTREHPHLGTIFKNPSLEDVEKHRVVVCTLATSRSLYNLGLQPGHFTHILLDEAAQALECETIMPLVLADKHTRLVLAGDHKQLSPEVHSDYAREKRLDVSFLERMFDIYPPDFPCKILLCENYRSHKAIIDLTSELFYDTRLVASGNQPRHSTLYPLTFYTAKGQDSQHQNSSGFYNNAEVYEVVERVCELVQSWPESWGKCDHASIGVLAPYADQVGRIRSRLKEKKLPAVSVERVLNVQGKQFRAVFLSTVRTRHTCGGYGALRDQDDHDFGFLSNVKLLNTAITRAQSLLAVVGDPVSLCSIGKCRKLWERFISLCDENDSLFGTTWKMICAQLDGVELKTSKLNPLAPEFVPNRLWHPCLGMSAPSAAHDVNQASAMYGLPGFQGPLRMVPPNLQRVPPNMANQVPFMHPTMVNVPQGQALYYIPPLPAQAQGRFIARPAPPPYASAAGQSYGPTAMQPPPPQIPLQPKIPFFYPPEYGPQLLPNAAAALAYNLPYPGAQQYRTARLPVPTPAQLMALHQQQQRLLGAPLHIQPPVVSAAAASLSPSAVSPLQRQLQQQQLNQQLSVAGSSNVVSPTAATMMRSNSASPSAASRVQILPKAVNVRTPPLSTSKPMASYSTAAKHGFGQQQQLSYTNAQITHMQYLQHQQMAAADEREPIHMGDPAYANEAATTKPQELLSTDGDSGRSSSRSGARAKAPLYMRRAAHAAAAGGEPAASPPRLSYASVVRTNLNANIDDIPERTPQTVGTFVDEDNPFHLAPHQPLSAESLLSPVSGDPLDLLKNIRMQESPISSNLYPTFPSP